MNIKEEEKKDKIGVNAIINIYPKDFETSVSIYMDNRGMIFNTKQKKIK